MKVFDSNPPPASHPLPGPRQPADNGATWQAQLQMAYLCEWREESGRASPHPAPSQQPESRAAGGSALHAIHAPFPVMPTASLPASPSPAFAGAPASAPLAPDGGWAGAFAAAPTNTGREPRRAPQAESQSATTQGTAFLPACRGQEETAVARMARAEEPARPGPASARPRYGKQLMQLSLAGNAPQVTLRDASLDAAAAGAVALSLASELKSQGIALHRVYINGRRFDHAELDSPQATQAPRGFAAMNHIDQE
jgi:hypothetical protein